MATVPAARAGIAWTRSLGGKLLLILAAVALSGAVALTLILTAVIMPSFAALEHRAIVTAVERTRSAIARQGAAAADAALVARGQGSEPGPAASAFRGIRLDRIAMRGRAGYDFLSVNNTPMVVGFARTPSDTFDRLDSYQVVARPIDIAALRRDLGETTRIGPANGAGTVAEMDADTMRVAVPVLDAAKRPIAMIETRAPRDLAKLGRHVLWLAVAAMTILLVTMLMVLRRLIAVLVLRRIGRIEAHMQRVRDSGAFTPLRVSRQARDEIALLGHSFNSMLAQLKDLSEQVEAQSFALGRTESAVAVMHNVRNALTPVTTILGTSLDRMDPPDRRVIGRALAELGDPATSPDRRARLVDFVAAAFAVEDQLRTDGRDQLRIGQDAMSQVLEIIGAQQAQAHARPMLESCDATQIIAQNAAIAGHAVDGASVAISFPARNCLVVANRLLLSQVIGNLLSNAVEAIEAAGGAGAITVSIEDGADGTVNITIRDDGEGFDATTGAQVFQRGFSTRAHKSGGLGLHWCANSMAAMGGTLRLDSEGPGRGAVARLTLSAPDRGGMASDLAA